MEEFKNEIKLILFDCDGTLVNSEPLYNRATSEILTGLGFKQFTTQYCIEHLAGCSHRDLINVVKALGLEDPQGVVRQMHHRALELTREKLDIIPNAHLLLNEVNIPKCVVSNGERFMVLESLKITELEKYFTDDIIFTRELVDNPKPAPDLYLLAAKEMGDFKPENCIVVEDSIVGIRSGVAAGMRVIGIASAAHHNSITEQYMREAGASAIIKDLRDVLKYL